MDELNWTYILYLLIGIPSAASLFSIAIKDKSVSTLFFGLAMTSFLLGIIIDFIIEKDMVVAREWGDLISITFTLSALFIKIRNSKPIFARFPLYLTMLPFLVLIFYPLVLNATVVKELLQTTYQGGAILVSILVISINHYLYKGRSLLLFASLLFLISYVLFWFSGSQSPALTALISKILFTLGIIVGTVGLKRISVNKNTQVP